MYQHALICSETLFSSSLVGRESLFPLQSFRNQDTRGPTFFLAALSSQPSRLISTTSPNPKLKVEDAHGALECCWHLNHGLEIAMRVFWFTHSVLSTQSSRGLPVASLLPPTNTSCTRAGTSLSHGRQHNSD